MKANKAPEKIWVHELSAKELNVPLKEYHIEYIRTDAFIDKARKWFEHQYEWYDRIGVRHCDMKDFNDFLNYIKVE